MIRPSGATAGALANIPLYLGDYQPRLGEVGIVDPSYPVGHASRHGCKPDSTTAALGTDNTAFLNNAIQSAVAAGVELYIPGCQAGKYFGIHGQLNVPSGLKVRGCGTLSRVKQFAAETATFYGTAVDDVSFESFLLYGQGGYSNAWVDDNHFDRGIYLDSCTNVTLKHIRTRNFAVAGIWLQNCPSRVMEDIKCQGTHNLGAPINPHSAHQYGIVDVRLDPLPTLKNLHLADIECWDVAYGLDLGDTYEVTISGLQLHDIVGQHGFYCGASKLTVSNFVLRDFQDSGIKLFFGTVGNQLSASFTNGVMESSLDSSVALNIGAHAPGTLIDVLLENIQIKNTAVDPVNHGLADGIDIGGVTRLSAKNVTIWRPQQTGVKIANDPCVDINLEGVRVIECNAFGLDQSVDVQKLRLRGCEFTPGAGAIAGGFTGIHLNSTGDDFELVDVNVIGQFQNSLSVASATNVRIRGGSLQGYGSEPLVVGAGVVLRQYENVVDNKEMTGYGAVPGVLAPYDRNLTLSAATGPLLAPLPDATKCKGRVYTAVKVDGTGNAAGFAPTLGQAIIAGGSTTVAFAVVKLRSDGANWFPAL